MRPGRRRARRGRSAPRLAGLDSAEAFDPRAFSIDQVNARLGHLTAARSAFHTVAREQRETTADQRRDRAKITFIERQQPPRPESVRQDHHG